MLKVRVAVHLTQNQAEKLAEIAKKNGGTVAGLVRLSVDEWLQRYDIRQAQIIKYEAEFERQAALKKGQD